MPITLTEQGLAHALRDIQSLLEKTGAKNTPSLVKYAMEQGLLKK